LAESAAEDVKAGRRPQPLRALPGFSASRNIAVMGNSSHDSGQLPGGQGADRRVYQRRTVTPRLYVLLGGSGADGILNDVSEGGVALDIVGSQPPGEYVDVDFEMSELGRHFEAKGRVTWRDESAKKVGVTFVDLPEQARGQIRQWLAMKAAPGQGAQPAVVLEADGEGGLNASDARRRETPVEPPAETAAAKPTVERLSETKSGAASPADLETPAKRKDDLVQNLVDSFNTAPKKLDNKYSDVVATWKQHSSGWNTETEFFSAWGYWRWIAVGAVAALAVLLAIGVAAHRLPWGKVASISVSKAGQTSGAAAQNAQNQTAENTGGVGGDVANTPRNEVRSEQDHNVQVNGGQTNGGQDKSGFANSANAAANAVTSAPSVPPGVASALAKAGQSPCINLSPNGGKIRIYLWTEKNTPEAVVASYAKNLRGVQDVQLVDKAPYDLVMYVNGARVNSNGAQDGFMWSSRVFRPWYCGESAGLLEQTEVNESLHYAPGANLEQRIQAEVAYLILHTFESIRNEHQK
jgi:PilZ domain